MRKKINSFQQTQHLSQMLIKNIMYAIAFHLIIFQKKKKDCRCSR